MTHLDSLELRLSNEKIRLRQAKTKAEKEQRSVWIKQIEKEIAGEKEFVKHTELTDDEILKELES